MGFECQDRGRAQLQQSAQRATQALRWGTPIRESPTSTTNAYPSASRAFCSSGVSLAMPMPVAAQRRAKKMAIQLEIAQGM